MATIRSRAYEAALRSLRPGIEIVSLPCPLFVSLAEEGWVDGDVAEAVAHRYLDPLAGSGVDTLVLGCTHYPLLKDVIARVMGAGVGLVDSAEETAADVVRALDESGLRSGRTDGGRIDVCLSDVPYRCREICERFLGRPIERVEQVAEHAGTERELAWHDTTAEEGTGCGR
jgi:glutamate racemase